MSAVVCPNCGCVGCIIIPYWEFGTDDPDDFTVTAGTMDLTNGTTSTDNTIAVHDTVMPSGLTRVFYQLYCSGTNGDELTLVFAYTDSSNFWYAQGIRGATGFDGAIKLYEVSGGTHTQRGTTGVVADFDLAAGIMVLQVCVYPEGVESRMFDDNNPPPDGPVGGVNYTSTPPSLAGTKCGVGTRNIGSQVAFYNILAYEIIPASDDPDCIKSCFAKDDDEVIACPDLEGVDNCCHERTAGGPGTDYPATLTLNLFDGWDSELDAVNPPNHVAPSCPGTSLEDQSITFNYDECRVGVYTYIVLVYSEIITISGCGDPFAVFFQCIGNRYYFYISRGSVWAVCELSILDCDPLHAVSPLGFIEITE